MVSTKVILYYLLLLRPYPNGIWNLRKITGNELKTGMLTVRSIVDNIPKESHPIPTNVTRPRPDEMYSAVGIIPGLSCADMTREEGKCNKPGSTKCLLIVVSRGIK
jgi:hypothetical protein